MSTVDDMVLVVRGQADDVSLAALVTVLAGLASAAPRERPPAARSAWASESWGHGPGAWRRSGLPR